MFIPFFFFIIAGSVSAQSQSIESLQAQIRDLLAIVSELQVQLVNINNKGNIDTVTTATTLFTVNLAVGDENGHVKLLQEFLNKDSRTMVAISGVGSPGRETNYFGNKTQDAVIRFQELHRNEILTPINLTRGTGFVGPGTRKVLEVLSVYGRTSPRDGKQEEYTNFVEVTIKPKTEVINIIEEVVVAPVLITLPPAEIPDVMYVTNFSHRYVLPGDTLTISGEGFASINNRIRFGGIWHENFARSKDNNLIFVIPDIDPGIYKLIVDNGKVQSLDIDIVVTVSNPVAPIITSVFPSVLSNGTIVTLFGTGLAGTENILQIDNFILRDISSDDDSALSFKLALPVFNQDDYPQAMLDALGPDVVSSLEQSTWIFSDGNERSMYITIINQNGKSKVFEARFK